MSRTILICRFSLAFMWLFTAATSVWWGRSIGYDVLAIADIYEEYADFLHKCRCCIGCNNWFLVAERQISGLVL